jgi:hydrogenase maturation protease
MSSIRIVGVGSPPGDSVGLMAIDNLEQMGLPANFPGHQITLERLDRPGPLLLDCIQGADLAIILDALVSNHEPGEVVPLNPGDITTEEWALSGNSLGVAETIALGSVLGELPERLLILGIVVGQSGELIPDNSEIGLNTMEKLQNSISKEIG